MVENEACAIVIQVALDSEVKYLKVYRDSALVIYQLRGDWETWDAKLIPYHKHIKELSKHFKDITFHHISREDNQITNALTTLSFMFKINDQTYVNKIENHDS